MLHDDEVATAPRSRGPRLGVPSLVNLGVTRLVAANFGLCAFAIAIIAGLAAGNPASSILATGLFAMIICHLVGLGLGAIAERVVADHIAAYTAAHPIGQPAQSTKEVKRDPMS